jgi:hypothetical protein
MNEPELASAFGLVIIEAPLYKTGALYFSVKCDVDFEDDTLIIHVFSKDYIRYHLEEKRLIQKFIETPEFNAVCSKWIAIRLDQLLQISFDGGPEFDPNSAVPKVKIKVN